MNRPPVFCDECPTLALALLDDAPLCAGHLRKALKRGDAERSGVIEPLTFTSFPDTLPALACLYPEDADF